MQELSAEKMPDYLEQIINTETSLYQLKKVKTKTEQRIQQLEYHIDHITKYPSSRLIGKPIYATLIKPIEPPKPKKEHNWVNHPTLFGMIIQGAVDASHNGKEKETYKQRLSQYYEDLDRYNKEKEEHDQAFEQQELEYKKKVQEANDRDEKDKHEYPILIQKENDFLKELDENIASTQETLDKLYGLDIIYPKYRNLVAMCSMYEYFVTGRVSQLKGADGAYNLYESELRQDLIIAQLDRISAGLEKIKQNQYMLYSQLSKANEFLSSISDVAFQTLEVATDIRKTQIYTNSILSSIKSNTEAIKYISAANLLFN